MAVIVILGMAANTSWMVVVGQSLPVDYQAIYEFLNVSLSPKLNTKTNQPICFNLSIRLYKNCISIYVLAYLFTNQYRIILKPPLT